MPILITQSSVTNGIKKRECLPSSQEGGVLPGNHNGLSGGSGSQTLDTPFVAFTITPLLPTRHFVIFSVKRF